MRKIIFYALCVTLFAQCTPQKRLSRLLRKNPELISKDTIFKSDTTIVYGTSKDTVFNTSITKDTLVIRDKQLEIRYYNDGKTTYLKGKCDTVWAIKEIPVQINSVEVDVIKKKKWYKKLWDECIDLLAIIGVLALLFIILDLIAAKMK